MLHRKENEEPNQNKVFALFLVSEDARGQQCRAGSDPQGRGHVCQPLLLFNLKGHFRAPTFEGCPRIGGGGVNTLLQHLGSPPGHPHYGH